MSNCRQKRLAVKKKLVFLTAFCNCRKSFVANSNIFCSTLLHLTMKRPLSFVTNFKYKFPVANFTIFTQQKQVYSYCQTWQNMSEFSNPTRKILEPNFIILTRSKNELTRDPTCVFFADQPDSTKTQTKNVFFFGKKNSKIKTILV